MKKALICLFITTLLIFGLVILTGCSSTTVSFMDMRYIETDRYTKKEQPIDWDNYKVLNYTLGNDDTESIHLFCHINDDIKNHIYTDMFTYTEKEINGIKWQYCHANDFGIEYDTYTVQNKNDVYIVELNGTDKYQEVFDAFMNSISFN